MWRRWRQSGSRCRCWCWNGFRRCPPTSTVTWPVTWPLTTPTTGYCGQSHWSQRRRQSRHRRSQSLSLFSTPANTQQRHRRRRQQSSPHIRKVCGNLSQTYEASTAMWNRTLLPTIRHRWTRFVLSLVHSDKLNSTQLNWTHLNWYDSFQLVLNILALSSWVELSTRVFLRAHSESRNSARLNWPSFPFQCVEFGDEMSDGY